MAVLPPKVNYFRRQIHTRTDTSAQPRHTNRESGLCTFASRITSLSYSQNERLYRITYFSSRRILIVQLYNYLDGRLDVHFCYHYYFFSFFTFKTTNVFNRNRTDIYERDDRAWLVGGSILLLSPL